MSEETVKSKEIIEKGANQKIYELAFNLITEVGDSGAKDEFAKLKKVIENREGKVVSASEPAFIDLAYTMVKKADSKKVKYNNAYFGWIKFNIDSTESLKLIKEDLDLNTKILRYMIIHSVKETDIEASTLSNLISNKREDKFFDPEAEVKVEDKEDASKDAEEEGKEIDKAIDELVAPKSE